MQKFMSRKFLAVVAGVLFNLINGILEANGLPAMPESVLDSINQLLMLYIGAEGVADVLSRANTSK